MAGRDVSQLLLQVDANVAVAERNLRQLSRVVQAESGNMDTSLRKVEVAHGRMTLAGNNSRIALLEVQHVARGAADQFAAGTPLTQIFAQHVAQLGQAAGYAGDSMGKFGAFLGGPWGIALTLATVVLAKLTLGHKDAGTSVEDLIDKMRKQADQAAANEKADRAWQSTLEGVEDALRKNKKALDDLSSSEKSAAEKDLAAALTAKGRLDGIISETRANIDLARSLYEVQKARASGPGQRGEIASLGLEGKLGNLDALESRLAQAQADSRNAAQQIEEATSQVFKTAASETQAELIKHKYDGLIEKARQRAVAEHKVGDELIRQIAQLEKLKESEIKAAEARAKKPSTSDAFGFGRQIDFARAEEIARSAGLQVNSGFRSVAEQRALFNNPNVNRPGNPVASPGASAHNGANGKWAIDVQITDGLTPGKIRQIYAEQGVSLTKVLKEKGHFHIEGSRSEAAHSEREADTAAQKAQRQEDAFLEACDRLNQELLATQSRVILGIDGQAQAAEDLVKSEEKRLNQAIQNDLAEGKFGDATSKVAQARAEQLQAINHSVALAKISNIELQKEIRHIQSGDQDAEQEARFRTEGLDYQDQIATTQADHRRIQLEILDIVYQEKEQHLKSLKLLAEKNGDLEEANRIQQQINHLPEEKARDTDKVRRGTMDPLEAWAKSIPKTAAEITEALQDIEARGLDNLANSITDVIMGTKSLGAAFKDIARSIIADIVQMTIRMLVFRAISSAFGGSGGGLGGLFGGGGSTSLMTGSSNIFSFASGGSFMVGGRGGIDNNLLSINGGPVARISSGETVSVLPRASGVNPRGAANSNAPVEILVHVAASEDFNTKVVNLSTQTVRQAAPVIVRAAQAETVRSLSRPRLMGR